MGHRSSFKFLMLGLAIGIALWWRGGALAVAELSPADVRTEFSIVAVCLVGALALARPFLLPDPVLLGGSVRSNEMVICTAPDAARSKR